MTQNEELLFRNGFMFGYWVTQSLTNTVTPEQVRAQLRLIADGEITLQPSPEDIFPHLKDEIKRKLGSQFGEDAPELAALQEQLRAQMNASRVQGDKVNREAAELLYRLLREM